MAEKIKVLQAGRGLAALAVVLYHLNGSTFGRSGYFAGELDPLLAAGRSGVQFFFVLSGFLMMWLHADMLGDRTRVRPFVMKRVVRIYPTYWAVMTVLLPIYFIMPGFGDGDETQLWTIVSSYLLLPEHTDPILDVAWTLRFEMFFYAVFALLIAFPRVMLPAIFGWGVAMLLLQFTDLGYPGSFFLAPICLLFLYGMIAGAIARRRVRHASWLAAIGLIGFAVTWWAEVHLDLSRLAQIHGYGLSTALALTGLVALERDDRFRVPGALVYLGETSYALYLIHPPLLSLLAKTAVATGHADLIPRPVMALAFVLCCIATGAIIHELVENRLLKWRPKERGEKVRNVMTARGDTA